MTSKPWWEMEPGPERDALKLATERHEPEPRPKPPRLDKHWMKVASHDGGVIEVEHDTSGAHGFVGGSGWLHRWSNEASRREAMLLSLGPWRRFPSDIATFLPCGYGYLIVAHCNTRCTSVVLYPKFSSLKTALHALRDQTDAFALSPEAVKAGIDRAIREKKAKL